MNRTLAALLVTACACTTPARAQAPIPSSLPSVNPPGCSAASPANCTAWTPQQWQTFMNFVGTKADSVSGNLSGAILSGASINTTTLNNDTFANPTFTGSLTTAGTPGVSCSGSPTGSFASINGIVTHC